MKHAKLSLIVVSMAAAAVFAAPRNLRTDGGLLRFTIPPLERVVAN